MHVDACETDIDHHRDIERIAQFELAIGSNCDARQIIDGQMSQEPGRLGLSERT